MWTEKGQLLAGLPLFTCPRNVPGRVPEDIANFCVPSRLKLQVVIRACQPLKAPRVLAAHRAAHLDSSAR
jgi:hypothetical protein